MSEIPERVWASPSGHWHPFEGEEGTVECVRADLYDALEQENKELREVTRWQPIETAPKDGMVIMLCERAEQFATLGVFHEDKWHGLDYVFEGKAGVILSPDYWMPLPQPQKGNENEF